MYTRAHREGYVIVLISVFVVWCNQLIRGSDMHIHTLIAHITQITNWWWITCRPAHLCHVPFTHMKIQPSKSKLWHFDTNDWLYRENIWLDNQISQNVEWLTHNKNIPSYVFVDWAIAWHAMKVMMMDFHCTLYLQWITASSRRLKQNTFSSWGLLAKIMTISILAMFICVCCLVTVDDVEGHSSLGKWRPSRPVSCRVADCRIATSGSQAKSIIISYPQICAAESQRW